MGEPHRIVVAFPLLFSVACAAEQTSGDAEDIHTTRCGASMRDWYGLQTDAIPPPRLE
jgi:hypothetical protein